MLKQPLQAHSFRQPHVTKVTCSRVDTLPSGPSSRFRQCSCAIAHAGEKCNPIIGTLRYLHQDITKNVFGNRVKTIY